MKHISAKRRKDFEKRLRTRYGRRNANFYLFCEKVWKSLDVTNTASLLFIVDGLILTGSDQELKEFRDSRASICITAGVAGAVFTQVALTALSLPQMESAHWVARGLMVISVTYGIFTVTTAVEEQALLSSWLDPKQIRVELSFLKPDTNTGESCNGAAIDPVLEIASPMRMLNFSSLAFFLGLAVYLGTVWTSGGTNTPGPYDTRNIFICFLCCFGFEVVKSAFVGFITARDLQSESYDEDDAQPLAEQGDAKDSQRA
ncbi:hypothetical protein MMC30_003355 [Trapelia coarctata]|nr:hypothetical protein [Trapelia coarctata]